MSIEVHTDLVQRVCRYIENQPECLPTLTEMGDYVGMSPFHLQRVFKKLTGVSPREYGESVRVQRLKAHLRGGANVTEALYDAGYGSSSARLRSTPSPDPPISPSDRITRWHGTTSGTGLAAQALATARTAFGCPIASAISR